MSTSRSRKQKPSVRSKRGQARSPQRTASERDLISVFTVAQDITIRTEELDGKEHLVLPMVALVEGVYQCANCEHANLYQASEFAKNVGAWNGRPATISHPKRGDAFVSAGSPDVWETERIGTIFNARLDGDKLRVEAWIDPDMVERAGDDAKQVLDAIEDGDQVEVSTAAWIDEAPRFGSYGGRKFEGVQMNFQPDHIAILRLGEIGACNWDDGCGIRVAQGKITEETVTVAKPGLQPATDVRSTNAVAVCCDDCAHGRLCECTPGTEDPDALQTARDLEYALSIALENEYGRYVYIADWDEEFVYFVAESLRGIQRRGYSEDADGAVTLSGEDEVRVRPKTEFVVAAAGDDALQVAAAADDSSNDDPPNPEDGDMPDTTKPAAAAEQPSDDKTTEQVQANPATPVDPKASATKADLTATDRRIAELEARVEHLTEQNAKLQNPVESVEEYLARAPEGLRATLMAAHKASTKRKLELVDTVAQAPGCMWSREQLEAKQIDELERLAGLATRTDFSVQPSTGHAMSRSVGEDDYAAMPPSPWDKPTNQAS